MFPSPKDSGLQMLLEEQILSWKSDLFENGGIERETAALSESTVSSESISNYLNIYSV